jgi:type III restriction enzyme
LQKSLVSAVYLDEMNRDERDVAVYLDGQAALGWWHRNVARKHYGLQGWRKGAIYPDFIFSVKEGGKTSKLIALETKGEHLEGYNDTEYKKAVMAFLTEHFDWESARHLGEMELETHGESIVCDMVMLDDWEEEVSCYFQ